MVRGNCNGVVAVVNTINMRGVLKWFAYNNAYNNGRAIPRARQELIALWLW